MGQAIVSAARERGLPISEADEFTSLTGYGVSARVGGEGVLVGSQSLMEQEGFFLDGLEERAETLEGEGKTVTFVATGGSIAGLVAVADTLKPGARQAVDSLRRLGLDVVMLTGDNPAAAGAIARQAGHRQVRSRSETRREG